MVEETVLVTGGCGFVGHRMVASLKADAYSVRVLDIPRAEFACVEDLGAKVLEGSVVDGESVRVALGNSRVVYHMAAPDITIRDERLKAKPDSAPRTLLQTMASGVTLGRGEFIAATPRAPRWVAWLKLPPVPVPDTTILPRTSMPS